MTGGPKSKDFWPTIKPFLSKKGSDGGSAVILCEEDKLISDQAEVCTIFNSFFANVATDIGKDCHIDNMEEHPSIQKIKQNLPTNTHNFLSNRYQALTSIKFYPLLTQRIPLVLIICRPKL